jgi:hypothetical protein
VYDAKKNMRERLQQSTDKLTEAVDRITEAEETITKIEASLRGVEGKEADSLRKAGTAIKAEIKKLRERIFGRTANERQGITRYADITTMSILQTANMEIMSKIAAPTEQTERLVTDAENAIKESLKIINAFFADKWKAYRNQAEATPMKLFKDYTPVE